MRAAWTKSRSCLDRYLVGPFCRKGLFHATWPANAEFLSGIDTQSSRSGHRAQHGRRDLPIRAWGGGDCSGMGVWVNANRRMPCVGLGSAIGQNGPKTTSCAKFRLFITSIRNIVIPARCNWPTRIVGNNRALRSSGHKTSPQGRMVRNGRKSSSWATGVFRRLGRSSLIPHPSSFIPHPSPFIPPPSPFRAAAPDDRSRSTALRRACGTLPPRGCSRSRPTRSGCAGGPHRRPAAGVP